jgi:hypothetical protein
MENEMSDTQKDTAIIELEAQRAMMGTRCVQLAVAFDEATRKLRECSVLIEKQKARIVELEAVIQPLNETERA